MSDLRGAVYVGIGSNLPGADDTQPIDHCRRALALLAKYAAIIACSPFYRSPPWPLSDQPWFINAVAKIDDGHKGAEDLLDCLHQIEAMMGRRRHRINSARIIDLDIIDYRQTCCQTPTIILPHPRLQMRSFVLYPLRDIAPDWYHPVSGQSIDQLIDRLQDKTIEKIAPP